MLKKYNINEEIEREGINRKTGLRLYDVYDAMGKVLHDAYRGLPQVNN